MILARVFGDDGDLGLNTDWNCWGGFDLAILEYV